MMPRQQPLLLVRAQGETRNKEQQKMEASAILLLAGMPSRPLVGLLQEAELRLMTAQSLSRSFLLLSKSYHWTLVS